MQALTVMHSYNAQELIHKIFCGSDNIQSEQLDAAVKCKRGELALVFATQCARDTDIGAYCSEVQVIWLNFIRLASPKRLLEHIWKNIALDYEHFAMLLVVALMRCH